MPYISIFHYLFTGVLIFQCIYMGISTILFKRRDTFFYFIFLFLAIINYLALNYNLFNLDHLNYETSVFFRLCFFPTSCLLVGFYTLFIVQFLEIKSSNASLFNFLRLISILNIAGGVVFGMLEFRHVNYMPVFFVLGFATYFVSFFMIYKISKNKFKYSKIIVAGIISSALGSLIGLTVVFVYDKNPPIVSHFFTEVGVLIDVFIYTIALNIKWKDSEKELLEVQLEKQKTLSKERQRIASEMHDELGGNLTSLIYAAHNLQGKSFQEVHIDKIIKSTGEISDSINEIVWALYQEQNTLADWVAFVRERTAEMLENATIKYDFHMPKSIPTIELNNQVKRSFYLVIKEAVNNVIKHAQASQVDIYFNFKNEIKIVIKDNGIGFLENGTPKPGGGNGLKNMNHRMEEIGGNITWKNGKGTTVTITHT
jgi:signal transduction histidine kinase